MLTILLTAMQETRIVVVNEYRRGLIGWIIIGLIAGWLAGKISRGDLILLVVFGAGLTWGAAVIEW